MRRFTALAVIAVAALAGCVSSGQQIELAGVAPPRQDAPTTVDLLPIESAVEVADPDHPIAGGDAGEALRAAVVSALPPALGARRFRLAAVIDGRAMSAAELDETRDELLRYAVAQRGSPRQLVPLHLPHPLGAATGSRATLFVAGYGVAGDDSTHAEDVLAALAVTEAVVATAGVVGEVASNDDGVDGVERAAGNYAATMADVNATLDEAEAARQLRPPRSHLRLVVTLVDNATGRVIWHSDREFAGRDPTDASAIRRSIERSLRHLPRPG